MQFGFWLMNENETLIKKKKIKQLKTSLVPDRVNVIFTSSLKKKKKKTESETKTKTLSNVNMPVIFLFYLIHCCSLNCEVIYEIKRTRAASF